MFKAKTVMTTAAISVNRQTEIYEAIKTMVENNITGLPVVNDDMSLAGVISEKDVLSLLCNIEDKPGKVKDFMTIRAGFFLDLISQNSYNYNVLFAS